MDLSQLLPGFRLGLVRFHLEATRDAALRTDEHPGALLRDRLGPALKQCCCPFSGPQCRESCAIPSLCPYGLLFKTTRQSIPAGQWMGQDMPRPFVLEPPAGNRRDYRAGDTLSFNLVLIGRGVEYFRYFVAAVESMASRGLGMPAAPWRLVRACALSSSHSRDGEILYGGGQFTAEMPLVPMTEIQRQAQEMPVDRLALEFLTPARLDQKGRLVSEVDVDNLGRALLRRISSLAKLWRGARMEINYRGILQTWSRSIRCDSSRLRVETWERVSGRDTTVRMEGFQGSLLLEGDLASIHPFLKLGEYLHIGKGTVMGMGQYRCVTESLP